MAHFLSDATHQRLELRDLPDEVWTEDKAYSSGIVKTHVFQSAMRCVAVVGNCHSDDQQGLGRYTPNAAEKPTTAFTTTMRKSLRTAALDVTKNVDAMPRLQLWSGDTEGTTTARVGLTGAPIHIVAAKKDKGTYAYSMHHHEPYVWVGFTDGFVHIFDAHNATKVCEIRAHTATVNVITSVGDYVFTAGSDWQILQWDPLEIKRVPHGQLSGHQNSVRCLAGVTTEGSAGLLYSGGDDYLIRCWDLDTGYERSDPWPIVGHTGSVRCIALHGVYLFSSSADGQVKAWNTQTAQLVRSLDDRGSGVGVCSLTVDAAAPAIWAGGTDGIIRMWDAQTLVLIGERTDHHTTNVALLSTVARANAVKAWVLDDAGALTTVFSDPDGACSISGQGGHAALKPMETELQHQVDTHRVRILHNYTELERCRDDFEALQTASRGAKARFAKASSRHFHKSLALSYEHQTKRFLQRRRIAIVDANTAIACFSQTQSKRLRQYFSTWCFVAQVRRATRQRKTLALWISAQRTAATTAHYAFVLNEHHRIALALRTKSATAESLALSNNKCTMRSFFYRWHRSSQTQIFRRQRTPFVKASLRQSASVLLPLYLAKLRTNVVNDRLAQGLKSTVNALHVSHPNELLRSVWSKWIRLSSIRRVDRVLQVTSGNLETALDRDAMSTAFHSWIHFVKHTKRAQIESELNANLEELTNVNASVVASEGVNEDALEAQLRESQRRLALLLQEERVWDERLKDEESHKRVVLRESMRSTAIDSSEPLPAQFQGAIYLLKARGVNVKHNEEDILSARQDKERTPYETFACGLAEIRKLCASAIRPLQFTDPEAPCWYVGPLFTKLSERKIIKATSGLAKMVTAYDMMNLKTFGSQWFQDEGKKLWRPEAAAFEEALENLGTLLEIAVRAFRIRRGEDMEKGGPKATQRVRSRSRSRSRSKSRGRSQSKPKPGKKTRNAENGMD